MAARKNCTMREFFAYRLQDRPNQFSLPLNGRRLFQQLLLDKYTMVESQRLHFIRGKQSELRSDTFESLQNLKTAGNSDVSTSGQRVILLSSFTGGSRYMMQNYLDAMCLCRRVPTVTRLPFHLPGQQQVIYVPEEDIEDVLTKTSNSVSMFTGLSLSDEQLKNLALLEIEEFLVSNNSSLRRFSHMSFLDQESVSTSMNPLMTEELSYDKDSLSNDFKLLLRETFDVSDLLKKTLLIIWDEAPMIQKHAFEALDRTLKDVMNVDLGNTSGSLFGGKNGTRNDCVNVTISSSYIWSKCKVLKLTKNMRLIVGSQMSNTLEIKQFADWLLDIGEGNLGGLNDGEATISIPDDLLIKDSLDPMSDLIDFVYPSMLERFNDLTYFQERALLAPLNDVV
ncbi:uncharacterized protein LOC143574791 [Bidens hawaiensis]|uniref:uncharacterized protein LOC143574791 n=1 Tax=Bidens hawaiensis TaxID=980011 RepID=UPI0040497863